jgi:uncharacterized protein GlcG (DUF336 family)
MIVMKPTLAAAAAFRLVGDAGAHAEAHDWRVAVAVVDPHGILLAAARMDDAAPPVIEFAQDKAYTAATLKRTTEAYFQRMESSPALRLGFANRPRLMVWGGGLPIFVEGRVVGGIGVSGARDFQDVECAEAALRAAGLAWEA